MLMSEEEKQSRQTEEKPIRTMEPTVEEELNDASILKVFRSLNYNVKLILLFYVVSSIALGIWMGNVMSFYIELLATESGGLFGLGSMQTLGLSSAASGITMTLFVFPSGFLADKYRRDIMLKIAAVIGIASMGIIIFGQSMIFVFIGLLVFGLFNALTRPALEALFADSITSGYRSRIYSWANLLRQFAMAFGPFFNIFLLLIFGNEWKLEIMTKVMYVGMAISVISLIILFLLKDDRSLGEASEAIPEEVTATAEKKEMLADKIEDIATKKPSLVIPLLLVSGNVIIGIGAGMTVKYFPLFFKEIYSLSPIIIQVIFGVTSIFTGIAGLIAQQFSKKRGRAQMIAGTQFVATLCLVGLIFYPPLGVLIPIFIARGSLMNAGMPLSRSILMDVVPKKNRGTWNSVEAIAWGLFWNFSAVIGGFLVGDNNNFRLCFTVTSITYMVGIIPILFLIPLVGKERLAMTEEEKRKVAKKTLTKSPEEIPESA
ncbi:MAG: MFS transporter [Candidatus Heimdallarchaeota archaeon]|nr:MFS transporter [Candidatus Heimdallarchaeota archaeon]